MTVRKNMCQKLTYVPCLAMSPCKQNIMSQLARIGAGHFRKDDKIA